MGSWPPKAEGDRGVLLRAYRESSKQVTSPSGSGVGAAAAGRTAPAIAFCTATP